MAIVTAFVAVGGGFLSSTYNQLVFSEKGVYNKIKIGREYPYGKEICSSLGRKPGKIHEIKQQARCKMQRALFWLKKTTRPVVMIVLLQTPVGIFNTLLFSVLAGGNADLLFEHL